MKRSIKTQFFSVLSLFASSSTLICCALPVLLTTLGLSSALIGIVDFFPFLITLTEYKIYVFIFVFVLLFLNYFMLYHVRMNVNTACEMKQDSSEEVMLACSDGSRWSIVMYWISVAVFCIGVFFSYGILIF